MRYLAAVVALAGITTPGMAQLTGTLAADTRLSPESDVPALSAGGSLAFDRARWTARANAALATLNGDLGYQAEYSIATTGAIGFRTRGSAEQPVGGAAVGEQTALGALSMTRGNATFMLGAGGIVTRGNLGAGGTMGGAVRLGNLQVSAEVGSFQLLSGEGIAAMPGFTNADPDTLAPQPQPSQVLRTLRHAALGATWRQGVLEVSGRVLNRTSLGSSGSLGWQAALTLGPFNGMRLRVGYGDAPTGTSLYLPYRKQVLFGFEAVRPMRRKNPPGDGAQGSVHEAGAVRVSSRSGVTSFEVVARGAASVELAGDFTSWEAVALSREGNSWRLAWPLAPGTYRCNIRIDGGAWVVPDGMVAARDEFGGEVGVLVVEA